MCHAAGVEVNDSNLKIGINCEKANRKLNQRFEQDYVQSESMLAHHDPSRISEGMNVLVTEPQN